MKREVLWLGAVLMLVATLAAIRLWPIHPDQERAAVYESVIRHYAAPLGRPALVVSLHGEALPAEVMDRIVDLQGRVYRTSDVEARYDRTGVPTYYTRDTHSPLPYVDMGDIVWTQPGFWHGAEAKVNVETAVVGSPEAGSVTLERTHDRWHLTP
jgi:hypothetical protein